MVFLGFGDGFFVLYLFLFFPYLGRLGCFRFFVITYIRFF